MSLLFLALPLLSPYHLKAFSSLCLLAGWLSALPHFLQVCQCPPQRPILTGVPPILDSLSLYPLVLLCHPWSWSLSVVCLLLCYQQKYFSVTVSSNWLLYQRASVITKNQNLAKSSKQMQFRAVRRSVKKPRENMNEPQPQSVQVTHRPSPPCVVHWDIRVFPASLHLFLPSIRLSAPLPSPLLPSSLLWWIICCIKLKALLPKPLDYLSVPVTVSLTVACIPGWPQAYCVAENDFSFSASCLSLLSAGIIPHLLCVVLWLELRDGKALYQRSCIFNLLLLVD